MPANRINPMAKQFDRIIIVIKSLLLNAKFDTKNIPFSIVENKSITS